MGAGGAGKGAGGAPQLYKNCKEIPKGEARPKFISEINLQIKELDSEVDRLRCRFKSEVGWVDESARLRVVELKTKRKQLTEQMIQM